MQADVDDLEECDGGGKSQVALHLANEVAAGRAVVGRQSRCPSISCNCLSVSAQMLQCDAQIVPRNRVIWRNDDESLELLLRIVPVLLREGQSGTRPVVGGAIVKCHWPI